MKLADFLAEQNLSQAEFAERINVTQSHVSRLVQGKAKPAFDLLGKIIKETQGRVCFEDFQASVETEAA